MKTTSQTFSQHPTNHKRPEVRRAGRGSQVSYWIAGVAVIVCGVGGLAKASDVTRVKKSSAAAESKSQTSELVVEGKARKVVQFDATHARRHAQLGTPVADVQSPNHAPSWSANESLSHRDSAASRNLVTRSPAIGVEEVIADSVPPPNDEVQLQSPLQSLQATDAWRGDKEPPSYALVQELAAPSNKSDRVPADSLGKSITSVNRVLKDLHPPGSLPIRAWQSTAPSASLSSPTTDDLPDAYRALVDDANNTPLKWTKPQHLTVASRPTAGTEANSSQQPAQRLAWLGPKNASKNRFDNLRSGDDLRSGDEGTEGLADQIASTDEAYRKSGAGGRGKSPTEDVDSELVKRLVSELPDNTNRKIQPAADPDWVTEIRFPLLRYTKQSELALVDAIHAAVQFAPEIEILRTQVGIDRAEIIKQEAGFDWNRFLETSWDERNVPVGSDLDGAVNRLENHTLASSLGLRKQNRYGGQLQLAQDLGIADSNSQFFNPQNQATATVALEYQQPLLQGAGYFVNTSVINIAVANAAVSQEELVAGLQEHVLQVVQAYWDLVSRRGEFIVQKRNYDRAIEIAKVVAGRKILDVGPVQSARAEATLASRRNALLQAEYAVVFAQEQLLRLIFGQCFKQSVDTEVIPVSSMLGPIRELDMDLELQVGLQNRPEVRRALQLIKRTSIEQGVAKNQLLPALGLSMTLSNKGLRGNRGLASAIDDQWNFGDPTYGIGLEYALPVGNRAAKANLRQAELRIRQFQKDFERVLSDVALEVRNAVHTVTLSGKQRRTTSSALSLAAKELDILQRRADLLIDGDEVGPLYLENILQAQDRLAAAELSYLDASSTYALAHFELQRANGGLLRCSPLPVEAAPTKTWSHRLTGHPSSSVPTNMPLETMPSTTMPLETMPTPAMHSPAMPAPTTHTNAIYGSEVESPAMHYSAHPPQVLGTPESTMVVPGASTDEGYIIPNSVQVFEQIVPNTMGPATAAHGPFQHQAIPGQAPAGRVHPPAGTTQPYPATASPPTSQPTSPFPLVPDHANPMLTPTPPASPGVSFHSGAHTGLPQAQTAGGIPGQPQMYVPAVQGNQTYGAGQTFGAGQTYDARKTYGPRQTPPAPTTTSTTGSPVVSIMEDYLPVAGGHNSTVNR